MTYAMPVNVTNFGELMIYSNNIVSGLIGQGILFSSFVIMMIYLINRGYTPLQTAIASSLMSFFIGTILFSMSLIELNILIVFMVIFLVSILGYMLTAD